MIKLTIEYTPRHLNLPRAPIPNVESLDIPVGNVDERLEFGLMEFHGLTPDFADTLPAER